MPSDLENIPEAYKGLPIEQLITAPLLGACKAQTELAMSTAKFIDDIGLRTEGDSKVARTVDFSMKRPVKNEDGSISEEMVDMSVPMLAIINTPNLLIEEVTSNFTMEVKSSAMSKSSLEAEAGIEGKATIGYGFLKASVSVHGSVSTHKENTRSSDNSSKYEISVKAKQAGTPEGLMKVLDMMATACEPRKITTTEKAKDQS